MKREIARAFHLLSRAERYINESKWKDLFELNTFFIDHKMYIFIKACAPYKNLTEWSGLIESKIRSFVSSLEQHPNVKVTPFCKAIKLKLTRKEINEHMHPEVLRDLRIKKKQKMKQQRLDKMKKKKEDAQRQRLRQIQLDLQRERQEKRESERLQKEKGVKKEESPETGEDANDLNPSNVKPKKESTQISINDGQTKSNGCDEDDDVMIISNLSVPVPQSNGDEDKKESVSPSLPPKNASKNPYVYVCKELQSKPRYRKASSGSLSNSASLEEQKAVKEEDKDVSVSITSSTRTSATFAASSPSISPWGDCAHRVNNRQITCCQSMSNKILREKAEKFGYDCKTFVIGLKVTKRAIAINNVGGKQIDTIPQFNFSRSVFGFLKGLNHIYTDSHLIIELLTSTKVPHFLFPQFEYRRPTKEYIEQHQENMAVKYQQWKSKSCIATMAPEKQKELSASPSVSTPKSGTSSPVKMPQFDADDILMNDDDDIEAMPGLGVVAPSIDKQPEDKILNETVINKKRSAEELEVAVNVKEPLTKKRKLSGPDRVILDNEEKQKKEDTKEEEINYLNPYFKEISFDKKYDNSPTFEYATKLYRKSQSFVSWEAVSHDLTATASHVVNTCNDRSWKGKLQKILQNEKYGWSGCQYRVQLSKKLMFDLAHDIAYNYIQHKNEKKRKRKYLL